MVWHSRRGRRRDLFRSRRQSQPEVHGGSAVPLVKRTKASALELNRALLWGALIFWLSARIAAWDGAFSYGTIARTRPVAWRLGHGIRSSPNPAFAVPVP